MAITTRKFLYKLARAHGVNKNTFKHRLERDWEILEALIVPNKWRRPQKTIDYFSELKNLNLADEYFNPKVNEFKDENFDIDDSETRFNALRRAFNVMYKQK